LQGKPETVPCCRRQLFRLGFQSVDCDYWQLQAAPISPRFILSVGAG